MNNIFITGGTGFLGSEIIKEILATSDDLIYALVRGKTQESAETRLLSTLSEISDGEITEEIFNKRIKVFQGDIGTDKLGLKEAEIDELIDKIDIIYNNAAVTDLNMPIEEIRKINVYGTRNVLDIAMRCKNEGKLKKVNHISTAYIVGKKQCVFKETDLDIGQDFNNTYEQSKFEAELLVEDYKKQELIVDIFRPSIITGRYSDGKTTNFKMFYQPLRYFYLGLFKEIPIFPDSKANMINVDVAAKAIVRIAKLRNRDLNSSIFHVVSKDVATFDFIFSLAGEYFGYRMPKYCHPKNFNNQKEFSSAQSYMISPFLPYFQYRTVFDLNTTLEILPKTDFSFPEFDRENYLRLYAYCDKTGFLKRKKS